MWTIFLIIFGVILGLILFGLWIYAFIWSFRKCETSEQTLITILLWLVVGVFALIYTVSINKENKQKSREKKLESEIVELQLAELKRLKSQKDEKKQEDSVKVEKDS